LKTSKTDLKNLFYREQEARQVLELDYKELAYECDKHMELLQIIVEAERGLREAAGPAEGA
jgi:hypothetical protein